MPRVHAQTFRTLALLTLLAGALVSHPAHVRASGEAAMTISPDKFEWAALPGATLHGTVNFTNFTTLPIPVAPQATDFKPNGEDGAIAVDTPTEAEARAHSLVTWLTASPSEVTIPPKSTVPISVDVHIPNDAVPGAHWGVLVFNTQDHYHLGALILLNVGSTPQNAQKETVTVASFAATPNTAPIATSNIPPSTITFTTRLKNEGEYYEKPVGTIEVTDLFGHKAGEVVLPAANILPGAIRRTQTTTASTGIKLRPGYYTATLTATYGQSQGMKEYTLTATTHFWIRRVTFFVTLATLLPLIVAVAAIILRRSRPDSPPTLSN